MKYRFLLAASVAALSLSPAYAQESAEAPADQGATSPQAAVDGGDIIVTARRRAETLQTVPVAVTAVSGENLRSLGVVNALDLARVTPSLTPTSVFSSNHLNFTIRGQAPENNNFGNNPTVEIYFADVVQIYPSLAGIYDMDSVQVLRGPQGTLFGRAANGGAVLYSPKAPGNEFEGYISGQIGNYNDREVEGALTIPVVPDVLSIRVTGNVVRRDGYTKILNQDNFDLDNKHSDAFRITAKLTPNEWLTNTTIFDYSNVDSHQSSWYLLAARPNGLASTIFSPTSPYPFFNAFLAANPDLAAIPGVSQGLQGYLNTVQQLGPRKVYYNTPSDLLIYKNKVQNFINKLELDFDAVKLKYVLGYQRMYVALGYSADASPFPILDGYQPTFAPTARASQKKQFSHELQLSGMVGNNLDWMVGGYYEERDDIVPGNTLFGQAFGGFFTGSTTTVLNGIDTRSKAIFGQATYKVTNKLRVTGGIRYTWDNIHAQSYSALTPTGLPNGQASGITVCPGTNTPFSVYEAACRGVLTRQSPNDANWTGSIDWRPTDNMMFYASAKHGYRPGGVSTTVVVPALREYKPESITEYELGAKLNGYIGTVRGRLALSLFQQEIRDAQRGVIIFNPLTSQAQGFTTNAAKAQVRGVEVEGELIFNKWFRISGFADYTDAKYKAFDIPVIGLTGGELAIVGHDEATANPFPNVPKYHASVNATVTLPVPDDWGKISVNANYLYQSRFVFAVQSDLEPEAVAPGYGLVNGRIAWNDVLGAPVDASFFVNNLTNKTYFRGGIGLQTLLGITHASVGEPRTYGMQLRFRF
ncbi:MULTISPECIES: TonB-dependent receptor [Sphingobium]|uniref:TonB-dependent receptor n=1 Tax=Sphingobium TaxID=165695 RepID=UPI00159C4083|nr:TonB-dependent receptor [Sphingobium sp. 15-1]